MVEQDGLGLVFEQQGNTGAAAYNQPTLQMGQTPFDVLAERQRQDQLIKDKRDYIEKQRAEEQARVEQEAIKPIDLVGWEERDMQELGQIGNQLKTDWYNLKKEGVDPTDWSNPKALDYQKKYNEAMNKVGASKQHKAEYVAAVKELQANPDKYDIPKSVEALNALASGKITDRMGKPFATGLIPKAKKIDILAPLEQLKGDFMGEYSEDNPESGRSGTYVREKQIRDNMQAIVDNPANAEDVAANLVAGDFKDKKEYVDYLVKIKKNQLAPKTSTTIKAPKGEKSYTITDIDSGNTQDQLKELGVGDFSANVTVNKSTGETIEGKLAKVNIPNGVTLGNISVDVPAASVIIANTGKAGKSTKNFKITSGIMGTPLVYKNSNRVVPTTAESVSYQKDGKWITLSKKDYTPEQISQKLIDEGVAEYKPMIFGTAEAPSDADPSKSDKTSVWIPANSVIHGTDKKDKALNSGEKAYYILKKAADEKNKGAGGKQIKQSDIAAKASAAGYTVKEYTDLLKKNGVTIIP